MEPLSIVGAVSSIVSIIDVATRCISSLRALQQRWTGADWTVNLLVGQLVTLKAALDQIREWSATNLSTEPQHHQLVMDLDTSLESCRLLISVIDSHVSSLEWDEADTLTFESKMKAVWKDQSIQNCMNHLHHQTAALNLLLTALNCRSLSDQRDILLMSASRSIIDQVKDDSSSLVCLRDYSSFRSPWTCSTNRSSLWSRTFQFDPELLASGVYQSQIRSLMRRAFHKGKKLDDASSLAKPKIRSVRKVEMAKSAAIEHQIRQDELSERIVVKLLLLGSQNKEPFVVLDLMHLHQFKSYSLDVRVSYKRTIISSILNTMSITLQELNGTGLLLNDIDKQRDIEKFEIYSKLTEVDSLPLEVATAMKSLWQHEAVKQCYQKCKHQICWRAPDYYLDSISRIANPEYVPNDRDILYSKKDYGITDTAFDFGKSIFRFVKPAPEMSRMSRIKKRLAMFEDVITVVFEVDLSLYDEMLLDLDDGRMVHTPGLYIALREFGDLCFHMPWKNIILILDKYGLFREKIRTRPLQAYYPDYPGGADDAMVGDYLVELFQSKNENKYRNIYYHFIEHDNQDIAQFLKIAVRQIIHEEDMENGGLLYPTREKGRIGKCKTER